jgi:hypothetical protein
MGTSLLLFGLSSAAYLQGCLSYEGGYGMVWLVSSPFHVF